MPRLPSLRPEDVVRVALRLGFLLDRQKGSHAIYLDSEHRRRLVVPMHKKMLKRGTLRGLISDLGISVEDFLGLLRR